jgi:hypothetical protein
MRVIMTTQVTKGRYKKEINPRREKLKINLESVIIITVP